jgi:hypothetical protein
MYIYMLLIFVVLLFCLSFYYPVNTCKKETLVNPFEDDPDPCIIKLKYVPLISSDIGYSNENNAIQKNYESILKMADYNQYKRSLDPSCRF